MTDPMESFFALIGLVVMCGLCGAAFTLGAALVCRAMKWAPVNTTINVIDQRSSETQG